MEDWEYQFTEYVRPTKDLQTQVRQAFEGHDLENMLSPLGSHDLETIEVDEELRAISSRLKFPGPILPEAWQERTRFVGELFHQIREQLSLPEKTTPTGDPPSIQEILEYPEFQNFSEVAEHLAAAYLKLRLSGDSLRIVSWVHNSLIEIGKKVSEDSRYSPPVQLAQSVPLLSETIQSVCAILDSTAEKMQREVQSNRDEFRAAFSIFDVARKQLLTAIEKSQTSLPPNDLASTVLNHVSKDLCSRPIDLTQAFEQLRPAATNLSLLGEQLDALSFRQTLSAESLPSFSTTPTLVFPDFAVEQTHAPIFEAGSGHRIDPLEWPAVPEELSSKPHSEIAQEAQDHYLRLLEKDELKGLWFLDEHERFYCDEIETVEANLQDSEQPLDELQRRIAQTYRIKLQALRRSRRLYMLKVGLLLKTEGSTYKEIEYNERVVRFGEALIDYKSKHGNVPDFKGLKGNFYDWCGRVIGMGRTTVRTAISDSNCLAKGRRGSTGEGLEETIALIMEYARQHMKRNQNSVDDN